MSRVVARPDWRRVAFRCLISLAAPVAVIVAEGYGMAADTPTLVKETFVYKTVGPTKIEADVYRRNGDELRPGVVWIHGGALIMGSRHGVPGDIRALCRERNYVLFSIDYRLAPEVKLPEIIADLKDAFRFIRDEGPARFHVDPQRLVVAGGSAGGYLTLMSGISVEPRPVALLAYYGYGDIDAPWYIQPSAHYRKQPLVKEEDARSVVGKEVLTGSDGKPRGTYYLYLRQNGLWTKEVGGFADPVADRAKIDPFCPVRNVTPQYPPTMLIHGTVDTDVDYQESVDMAAALKKVGVQNELISIENGEHGFGGGDPQVIADANARAMKWIRDHLEPAAAGQ